MNIERAHKLASLARSFRDPAVFLAQRLHSARTQDDFNYVVLAMRLCELPVETLPRTLALVQAQRCIDLMLAQTRNPDLSIPGHRTPKGCVQDYDLVPPSDEARKQLSEARKANGTGYKGPRLVGVRKVARHARFADEYARYQ